MNSIASAKKRFCNAIDRCVNILSIKEVENKLPKDSIEYSLIEMYRLDKIKWFENNKKGNPPKRPRKKPNLVKIKKEECNIDLLYELMLLKKDNNSIKFHTTPITENNKKIKIENGDEKDVLSAHQVELFRQ